MWRARLSAAVSIRWCFAQVPLLRRGSILPRSLMYRRMRPTSLKSIFWTLSTQNAQTLRRGRRGPP